MTDTSGIGCYGVFGMDLTRNVLFRQRRTLLNSLEAEEVSQEAFKEGEEEEQVHKGSG